MRLGRSALFPLVAAIATPAIAREKARVLINCWPDGRLKAIQVGPSRPMDVIDDQSYERIIKRALPNRRAEIVLINDIQTPYRCVGRFIYALQRLGYRHIGFISEPPPSKP